MFPGGQATAVPVACNGAHEDEGGSGVDAWRRLDEILAPVIGACGAFGVPFLLARSRELASRLSRGRYRELRRMAYQPCLVQPGQVADLVLGTLDGG